MQSALKETIRKLDATVDFSQYVDPATGFVPLVLFLHEAIGGERRPPSAPHNHSWAPLFSMPTDTTPADWSGHPGKNVIIYDNIPQPALSRAPDPYATRI